MTYAEYKAAYDAGVAQLVANGTVLQERETRVDIMLSILREHGIKMGRKGQYPIDQAFIDLINSSDTTECDIEQYIETKYNNLQDCLYSLASLVDAFTDRELRGRNHKVALHKLKPLFRIMMNLS